MEPRPDHEASAEPKGIGIDPLALAATFGALLLGALLVVLIEPLRDAVGDAIRGDTEALREELRSLPLDGVAVLYAVILVHTVVWYPAEIVDAAGGFVYGFWGGLLLVQTGWIVQGVIAWLVGREVARPVLRRLIGGRRFDEAERMIEHGGITLLLSMRLIPIIPFSLFSYVAGAARVPLWRFVWTTGVGYLPLTVLFIYLGSRLDSLSPTDPLLLGGVVVLIALIALGRPVSRRFAEARRAG